MLKCTVSTCWWSPKTLGEKFYLTASSGRMCGTALKLNWIDLNQISNSGRQSKTRLRGLIKLISKPFTFFPGNAIGQKKRKSPRFQLLQTSRFSNHLVDQKKRLWLPNLTIWEILSTSPALDAVSRYRISCLRGRGQTQGHSKSQSPSRFYILNDQTSIIKLNENIYWK